MWMKMTAATVIAAAAVGAAAQAVTLTVDPGKVLHRIDEKIYGHFLEHIYHSCNGGLWGELIWNRSFEQNPAGRWSIQGDCVVQDALATNQRLVFGDPAWRDYVLTLEARKTGGREGFLVLFRVRGEKDFYWANLGGWGNQRHQLERGRSGEDRWRAVGPSVRGRIEAGRWYRIQVRCEATRFRVSLDGKGLIDFEDPKGHRSGCVGVGTWATKAKFRNLKVTSLDGKTLHEGLPRQIERPQPALHWEAFGKGRVLVERNDPLNSALCQRVVVKGGEGGLRQGRLYLRKGEEYVGSLWARGKLAGGLAVRLTDGKRTLAEQSLPAPKAKWAEMPLRLRPSADAPDGAIELAVKGTGEVCVDQVSLMPASWRAAGGFRPDLLKAIAGLRPPIIRWPGGCFASSYQWKQGIGPQHKRLPHPREIWNDLDVYSFGTDEFVAMCRRVGAEPLIVVNIGSPNWNGDAASHDYLQDVLDWIEYCNGPPDSTWGRVRAANGHREPYGVAYWEIDNETWHMGAEGYAAAVNRFGPAMRKKDPSIKLLACGSGGYNQGWNRTVIGRAGKSFDYISTHHYEGPDNYASGPPRDEAFYRELKGIIDAGANPKIKVYCSEWNAQSTDWRTGLYCGGILNVFERCGEFFEIGGPALFLRHASARAWDNAFINFDHRRWFPAPNYVVMKLWRDHYAPHRVAIDGQSGPLNVVATKSADGKTVIVKAVNPTDRPTAVTLKLAGGVRPGKAELTLVAPGSLRSRNTLDAPRTVAPKPGRTRIEGGAVRFELPALSAAVVTVQAK